MLSAVIVVSLLLAVAAFVYAFIALKLDYNLQKDVKAKADKADETAQAASDAAKGDGGGLAANTSPQAAFSGVSEYIKALGTFADSLSKLKQGVAALVVGLALTVFAGVAAGVDAKVDDGEDGDEPEASVTRVVEAPHVRPE